MTEYITYKYRIYPTKMQTEKIVNSIDGCRALHNILLGDKIYQYEMMEQISIFKYRDYFWDFPFLKSIDPLSLSSVQLTLDKAFAACDLESGKYPPERQRTPMAAMLPHAQGWTATGSFSPPCGGCTAGQAPRPSCWGYS